MIINFQLLRKFELIIELARGLFAGLRSLVPRGVDGRHANHCGFRKVFFGLSQDLALKMIGAFVLVNKNISQVVRKEIVGFQELNFVVANVLIAL